MSSFCIVKYYLYPTVASIFNFQSIPGLLVHGMVLLVLGLQFNLYFTLYIFNICLENFEVKHNFLS